MELMVTRGAAGRPLSEKSSIGQLDVDGRPQCLTLEDRTRAPDAPKVFGETAIPLGRYPVTIERSPRFSELAGRDVFLPRLHNVPGYDGVLIHAGNKPEDTEGCILVGRTLGGDDEILESRMALAALQPLIQAALDRGEAVFLTVQLAPTATLP